MFTRQTTGSVICTSCGTLVGVNDAVCYNCNRRNPGLWGYAPAFRRLGQDLGFVPLVMGGTAALYLLSLLLSGTSLRPMLENPDASVKPYAFSQVRNGYAVRTTRWRYIEWAAGQQGAQLFDMDRDPNETRNLAADPAYAATVAALRPVLARYRATGQPQ